MSELKPKEKYVMSFEDCQKSIGGVCAGCGGEIVPVETVDNADQPTHWAGCMKCGRFGNGVLPEVFSIARKLVEGNYLDPIILKDENDEAERDYVLRNMTHRASRLVEVTLKLAKEEEKGFPIQTLMGTSFTIPWKVIAPFDKQCQNRLPIQALLLSAASFWSLARF